MSTQNQINCLRCKHCALLPETDMSDKRTLILCGKLGEKQEINLHGCLAADTRSASRFQGNRNSISAQRIGDRTFHHSSVEDAYLRVHFPQGDLASLAALTGRTEMALRRRAFRIKVGRVGYVESRAEKTNQGRAARGQVMNEAQRQFLKEVRAAGRWPLMAANNRTARARRTRQRNAIVQGVAERGAPFSWRTIVARSHRDSDGCKMKKQREKRAQKTKTI